MALELRMPQCDPSGSPGRVVEWRAGEGETLVAGQPVVWIECRKTVLELETFVAGVLLAVLVPAGAEARPHTILGIVGEPGEDLGALLAEAAAERGAG